MSVIHTNINTQLGFRTLRQNNYQIRRSLANLSTGYKINKAADDPSGSAIAEAMWSHITGLKTAVTNVQDGTNLIMTADGALKETEAILQRMRDLSVRSANEATLSPSDQLRLEQEFNSLRDELNRKADAITFNTIPLFQDGAEAYGTRVLQVGPGATGEYQLGVNITPVDASSLGVGAMAAGGNAHIDTTAGAQAAISSVELAITNVSELRAALGSIQNRLNRIALDITVEHYNIDHSQSRILDADMAKEVSGLAKHQILQQSATAMLAQANAQPQSVLHLLR